MRKLFARADKKPLLMTAIVLYRVQAARLIITIWHAIGRKAPR